MTIRERASLVLLVVGVAALGVAAYAYDGWRAVVAVVGVATLTVGVLLGLAEPLEQPVDGDGSL